MEQPLPTTPVGPAPHRTEFIAKIVYVLYLASLLPFLLGITSLVGVVMAYVYEGDAPDWMKTHFQLQVRTFWIWLLGAIVGVPLSYVGIGVAVLVFLAVWVVVRCVKGLRFLDRREPYPDPATWLW